MARRAEWRKPSSDPQDAALFLWGVRREALRSPWAAIPFYLSLYFGPPVALAAFVGSLGGLPLGVVAWIVGAALYPKALEPWVSRAKHRPFRALKDVLPLPLPAGTFPVHVTVRYGNSVTGMDEASAAFVDGWLHVEGRRVSFSLRAGDGRAELRRDALRIALPEFQTVVLDVGLDAHSAEFKNDALDWIATAERPEGEPILPPLRTLPLVYQGWCALGIGGFIIAVAIGIVRHGVDFGPFDLPATVLAYLGGLTFGRTLFMTKGQEDADRRAKVLAPPNVLAQKGQEPI